MHSKFIYAKIKLLFTKQLVTKLFKTFYTVYNINICNLLVHDCSNKEIILSQKSRYQFVRNECFYQKLY